MDRLTAMLNIRLHCHNLSENNRCIYRLIKGIDELYTLNNNKHKYIKKIYNKKQYYKYIDIYNLYPKLNSNGIYYIIFNTKPVNFILQLNNSHPFYPTRSYIYTKLDNYNLFIYNSIRKYLNDSYLDIINEIMSYLPSYVLIPLKKILINKYNFKYDDIDDIENISNWGPTYLYSGLPNLFNKYLKILNKINIIY
tara:strand:- start:107 stop:691 length:585 start_codon:yes stop_codon:yes gene_type:complete